MQSILAVTKPGNKVMRKKKKENEHKKNKN